MRKVVWPTKTPVGAHEVGDAFGPNRPLRGLLQGGYQARSPSANTRPSAAIASALASRESMAPNASGTATERPISGSTMLSNLAGWAVATTVHWRVSPARRWRSNTRDAGAGFGPNTLSSLGAR